MVYGPMRIINIILIKPCNGQFHKKKWICQLFFVNNVPFTKKKSKRSFRKFVQCIILLVNRITLIIIEFNIIKFDIPPLVLRCIIYYVHDGCLRMEQDGALNFRKNLSKNWVCIKSGRTMGATNEKRPNFYLQYLNMCYNFFGAISGLD